jgi:hypothetical protein
MVAVADWKTDGFYSTNSGVNGPAVKLVMRGTNPDVSERPDDARLTAVGWKRLITPAKRVRLPKIMLTEDQLFQVAPKIIRSVFSHRKSRCLTPVKKKDGSVITAEELAQSFFDPSCLPSRKSYLNHAIRHFTSTRPVAPAPAAPRNEEHDRDGNP